MIHSV